MKIALLFLILCQQALAGAGSLNHSGPMWTPRNLRGIGAWWDGFYGASGTITLLDISVPSGGKDMAAAAHQPTLVANQANGWQVVHFTNSQYVTTGTALTIGANWHGFWAGRLSNPTAAQMMGDSVSNIQVMAFTAGSVMDCNDVAAIRTSVSTPTVSSFCLLEYACASGVPSFYKNQADQGRAGAGTMSANMHFNGLGTVLVAAFLNGDMATGFMCTVNHEGTMSQAYAQEYCRRRFALY